MSSTGVSRPLDRPAQLPVGGDPENNREIAALEGGAERKPPIPALHGGRRAEWRWPASYSGIVSAKDSSGDVAGQPTVTRKTSRTKRSEERRVGKECRSRWS